MVETSQYCDFMQKNGKELDKIKKGISIKKDKSTIQREGTHKGFRNILNTTKV